MIAAAIVCGRVGFKRETILWAFAAVFIVVHALYFPTMRYRVPMEFVLLCYASVAMDCIVAAIRPPVHTADRMV